MAEGIFAKNSGGDDFEYPEAGSYLARCYRMIDIGTQPQTYQGKPSAPKRKVLVYFELLEDENGEKVEMSDGRPFSVMNRYTLSTHKSSILRKHIDAWRGKALSDEEAKSFNIVVLLDKYCRVDVSVDDSGDRTWVNVTNVTRSKKKEKPAGVNDTFWWSVEEPDMDAFNEFPEWLQNKIGESQEWQEQLAGMKQGEAVPAKTKDVVIEDLDEGEVDLGDIEF